MVSNLNKTATGPRMGSSGSPPTSRAASRLTPPHGHPDPGPDAGRGRPSPRRTAPTRDPGAPRRPFPSRPPGSARRPPSRPARVPAPSAPRSHRPDARRAGPGSSAATGEAPAGGASTLTPATSGVTPQPANPRARTSRRPAPAVRPNSGLRKCSRVVSGRPLPGRTPRLLRLRSASRPPVPPLARAPWPLRPGTAR